ncbi:DoxX family protein [Ornithinimicrobium sp. Y1694]|uniref:DoxX family protein n=1 Tax=Ornithinimicrobium sp. Y1694 TaxID=3418590 RepID=UPI003CF5246C
MAFPPVRAGSPAQRVAGGLPGETEGMPRRRPRHAAPVRREPATRGEALLASAFLASGTIHLVRPQVFEPIIPRALPAHRELVLASGVAEIVCGAGLLAPRTRRAAGAASAALLVAIWPANVQMSVSYGRRAARTGRPSDLAAFVATLARLPLQVPLIRIALGAARRP